MHRFTALMIAAVLAAFLCGCSQGESEEPAAPQETEASDGRISATADTVFGYPDTKASESGSGETIGTVAVFHAKSSDCTRESLELWCNQYVRWGLDDWCVVEFSDKPGYGVYASGAIVDVGVRFDSDYTVADDSEADSYIFNEKDASEPGELVAM